MEQSFLSIERTRSTVNTIRIKDQSLEHWASRRSLDRIQQVNHYTECLKGATVETVLLPTELTGGKLDRLKRFKSGLFRR